MPLIDSLPFDLDLPMLLKPQVAILCLAVGGWCALLRKPNKKPDKFGVGPWYFKNISNQPD